MERAYIGKMEGMGHRDRVVLLDFDRWAKAYELDAVTLKVSPLVRRPAEGEPTQGFLVRRQGRYQALVRMRGRLHYLCRGKLHDVDDACVLRTSAGPLRTLRFTSNGEVIAVCRWLDWELARRWFIPKRLDVARDENDFEDFDWSLFIENVFSTDRRERIGRSFK